MQNRLLSNVCWGLGFHARTVSIHCQLTWFANKLGRYRGYILEGYPTTFAEAEVQTLQIPDWLCTSQHSLQFRDSLCCFVSGKVIPIAGKPHLGIVHGKGARRRG